ncbi:beta-mannosidase [Chelonus insularis]|uniref:beta-mannosidase n=1 Tax=Chelonus insularis TaxID=460826 RepID=UPI00158941E9|nr:beta-mannosidase [Chelonus insularis]XP_034941419.1 beta-mannosidase [Chelonus insularis]
MKYSLLLLWTLLNYTCLVSCQLSDLWKVTVSNFVFDEVIPTDTFAALEKYLSYNTLFDDKDIEYRWIGNSSSFFENRFKSTPSLLEAKRVLLIFYGIDTYSTVVFNGYTLGKTSNMFSRYSFDIKNYLLNDTDPYNSLFIEIESPIEISAEMYYNQSKNYIVYPKCVPKEYNGECHINHIRKMQASFGWDWGPAIPTSGIWRDVRIVPINKVFIMDYTADVYQVENKNWKINVSTLLEIVPNDKNKPIDIIIKVQLDYGQGKYVTNEKSIKIDNGITQVIESITLNVSQTEVQRWWPNGYGKQILYNLTIFVDTESRSKLIGFRTVKLIQKPLEKGLSFYFRINGVPIFAKGSNLIPISIYPSKSLNKTYILHLLESTKEANMNMLRVWGGGVYESDYFYEMADKLGIMIWQDFMFACSMYPTTPEFLESVREEVIQNVWRLKSHPSVVIWAGNNENEAALYGNWYGTGTENIYKEDYIKLYVDVIKAEVEKLDSTRPFVVSSPSNALWADKNGWIGTDPYSNLYGDIHHYNYLANGWDINTYRRPRFSSEYGFQSLPSIHGLQNMTKDVANLTIDSVFLKHRQHLPFGYIYMKRLISQNLKIPQTNNSFQDFVNFIYLSQINQAQAVKLQSESYRQGKSSLNDAGEGYTMGALYWQLNDVWAAPSWSSIDDGGRWKMLHNYAKDFFAPIIISPRLLANHDLKIFVISDELQSRFNCSVEINVYRISGGVISKSFFNVTVIANAAYELITLKLEQILSDASCGNNFTEAKKNCIIELNLRNSTQGEIAPLNYVFPAPPKVLNLPVCPMTATIDSMNYSITIKSPCGIQLFVWFDLPGYIPGSFSENGFHILKGSKKIKFNPKFHFNLTSFVTEVKFMSLNQIYASLQPRNVIQIN